MRRGLAAPLAADAGQSDRGRDCSVGDGRTGIVECIRSRIQSFDGGRDRSTTSFGVLRRSTVILSRLKALGELFSKSRDAECENNYTA